MWHVACAHTSQIPSQTPTAPPNPRGVCLHLPVDVYPFSRLASFWLALTLICLCLLLLLMRGGKKSQNTCTLLLLEAHPCTCQRLCLIRSLPGVIMAHVSSIGGKRRKEEKGERGKEEGEQGSHQPLTHFIHPFIQIQGEHLLPFSLGEKSD